MRWLGIGFCASLLLGGIVTMPIQALLIAGCTCTLTYLAVTWRTRPILKAAKALAHAHCFGHVVLPEKELRALSEAVLIWGK